MIKIHRRWRQTHDMKANKCLSPGVFLPRSKAKYLQIPYGKLFKSAPYWEPGNFSFPQKHSTDSKTMFYKWLKLHQLWSCKLQHNWFLTFISFSSNNGRHHYYFLHINTSTIITITKYRQWYGNDRALYISWSASMMRTGQNTGPQTWFTNQSSCDWCKS